VIDHQPLHRKVSGITGSQTRSDTNGCSCHETVGLAKRYTATGKLAPPPARLLALNPSDWSEPHAVQEARDMRLLAWLHSAKELFHVDGAGVRTIASSAQLTDTRSRRTPSKGIDQSRGVE
jgi:hypothetical protein